MTTTYRGDGIYQVDEPSSAGFQCQWVTPGLPPILTCTHAATVRIVTEIGPAIEPTRWFDYACFYHAAVVAKGRADLVKAGRE